MSNVQSSGSIGLGTILFCIFLTLKLTDNIAWSWVWVFAPLWIPLSLVVIIVILAALLSHPR